MRLMVMMIAMLGLSGCAGSLTQLQLLAPEANDFSSALAAEYLAYAEAEAEQGHELTGEYFAAKGLKAWRGEAVGPEAISPATPKAQAERLKTASMVLMALLTDDVKHVVPQPAARAQLLFDCWTHQAVEHKKSADSCAEEFAPAVLELQTVAISLGLGKETAHELAFLPGSAKPGPALLKKIAAIAAGVKTAPAYMIELEGRKGSAAAGRLFAKRAVEIRKAFKARGVDETRVRLKHDAAEKAVYISADGPAIAKDKVRATVLTLTSTPSRP